MRKAQILVETIIGVGVVALVLSAIIPLFLIGIKAGAESWKGETAKLLGQETLEAAKALKEENWNNLYRPLGTNDKGEDNPYHLENQVGAWVLAAGAENITLNNLTFSRQIEINNVSRTGINGAGELETTYNASRDDPSTQKIIVKVAWPGSTGMEIIDYFSRHRNALWQQTDWSGGPGQANWQDPPANQFFSVTTNSVPGGDINSTIAGQLELAKIPGGTINEGNKFITSALTSIGRLNDAAYKDAVSFTAQKTTNINQIRLYVAEVQKGDQVSYRYGIQADSGGQPSGEYLSSNVANFNATGWQTVSIPSISLNLGVKYYIVVQYDSGSAPAGNRYINFRSSLPANYLVPKTGQSDNNLTTLRYTGSWNILNQNPIFLVRYTDSTYDGSPYDNFANRNIQGANFEGEAFTVTEDTTASGVGLYVAAANNNPAADNLYVTLRDVTDGVDLTDPNEIFATPAEVTTTFAWKDHNFAASVTLPAGHLFRLYFSSPGSNPGRNYLIVNESNPDLPEYIGSNWQGTDAVTTRSTDSGANFSDLTYVDLSYYLKIAALNTYAPWGELISSSLDTANSGGAGFNRISWNSLGILPAGTTVKMQLAANNDNSTWNWSGPNGLGTWYILSAGENVWTNLYSADASQNARYVRYKIRLETADQTATPKVDWVRVNWSY